MGDLVSKFIEKDQSILDPNPEEFKPFKLKLRKKKKPEQIKGKLRIPLPLKSGEDSQRNKENDNVQFESKGRVQ